MFPLCVRWRKFKDYLISYQNQCCCLKSTVSILNYYKETVESTFNVFDRICQQRNPHSQCGGATLHQSLSYSGEGIIIIIMSVLAVENYQRESSYCVFLVQGYVVIDTDISYTL